MLWVPVTIVAASAQLARTGIQSSLTGRIGTTGATMVRYLYAIPFALLTLAVVLVLGDERLARWTVPAVEWALAGAVAQIAATALMLKAMHMRGFAVAYAYIKTEPIMLALGGWWLLGDALPRLAWIGIVLATLGVIWSAMPRDNGVATLRGEAIAVALGVVGGALFGLSSLAFRAAILEFNGASPLVAAVQLMAFAVPTQSALLMFWLWFARRRSIALTMAAWRPGLAAGATSTIAMLFWFIGFALVAAAYVRTLALIEMPFAALMNHRISGTPLSRREWTGIALVVVGIALLMKAVAGSPP
jgi:drug/metabolite transporter (DMT)-like permease